MVKKEMKFGIPALMSIEDLARYYKISPPMVRAWVKSKSPFLPPSINVGTDTKPIIRFMASDVHNHIKTLRGVGKSNMTIKDQQAPDDDIVRIDDSLLDDDD